jgi:AcrR family transcriptional regulator
LRLSHPGLSRERLTALARRPAKARPRERLIAGIAAASARQGYIDTSVTRVIDAAGVSRATFYEQFADRGACFAAAQEHYEQLLLQRIADAIEATTPDRAPDAAIGALLGFVQSQPAGARLAMNEALVAGRAAIARRNRTVTDAGALIERARAQLPGEAPFPDIPAEILIGGLYRVLSGRMRRNQAVGESLQAELSAWIACYDQPLERHRWSTLTPGPRLERSPFIPEPSLRPPPPLPRGRHRLPAEDVSKNHRERILYATIELGQTKGYPDSTVADIIAVAGVARHVFYDSFPNKQTAFLAAQELILQHSLAVTAHGYFNASTWPDRVWESGHAYMQFMSDHPAMANMGFVEMVSLGPQGVQRQDDGMMANTIFLEEGYRDILGPERPPPQTSTAIAHAVFELGFRQATAGAITKLDRYLPHATWIVLTPFLGPAETNRFIEEKTKA